MILNNKKTISIHQPNYIPWLGYFYKIYQSDEFVFLDDVQFIKKGMHNYHYIKTPQGLYRLKYPVDNASRGALINEVSSKDDLGWKKAHLRILEFNYGKAPYFQEIMSDFSALIMEEYSDIAMMNTKIIKFISQKFGIQTTFVNSSKLNLETDGEQRIIDICRELGASVYYSGTGARKYQNENSFKNSGVDLRYSEFKPIIYQQFFGGYENNVSVLDYLMHCGYDWDRVLKNQ